MALRYYIYVSDSKLDMLSEQIPPPLRQRVAAELKVDIKVFSLSLRQTQSSETRTAKLRLIEAYIDENDFAGTVDEPKAYFRGSLEMRWAPIGMGIKPTTVFFVGQTEKTMLGLGGSVYHLMGHARGEATYSDSLTNFLIAAVEREANEVLPGKSDLERYEAEGLWAIPNLFDTMSGPPETVEFLARRLARKEAPPRDKYPEGKAIVLGTPIYVALTDTA